MLIGYERVSTDDQNLTLQNDALQVAGCDKIFSDKLSGVKADRPGLQQALNYVRPGDALVVWRLDLLGRSQSLRKLRTRLSNFAQHQLCSLRQRLNLIATAKKIVSLGKGCSA